MEQINPGPSCPTKTLKTKRPERNPRKDNANEEQVLFEQVGHTKWTLKENKILLESLEKFGLTRLQTISDLLPNRTYDQVRTYLWRVGREVHRLNAKERELESVHKVPQAEAAVGVAMAISERLKKPNVPAKQLSAITKSLLLIENLEQHPPSTGPNDIDFQKLYNALYMLMKGYPLPALDEASLKFFCESFYNLLRNASTYPIESFPLDDSESLEYLAGNMILNPLSLQIDSLKARLDLRKPPFDETKQSMKDWLSKSDWSLV